MKLVADEEGVMVEVQTEAQVSVAKREVRRRLRGRLDAMTDATRHDKSLAVARLVAATPEWRSAAVVMLYLSTPVEVDTAPLALKAWQAGKTVVVPRVSWDQRRMLPTEITSLSDDYLTTTGPGLREPRGGKVVPVDAIDLLIVPGLGFDRHGHRLGRGMGFYDRFLGQPEFLGATCGLAFAEQVVEELPVLPHDAPLSLLAVDDGLLRFTGESIGT